MRHQLEIKFGKLKQETDSFRHFGHDDLRDALSCNVSTSQRAYLDNLKELVINRVRGDGRTAETNATIIEVSEYRNLVAGIAWVGLTDPTAQAAASMFQNALPQPLVSDLVKVNTFLAQLKHEYQVTIFRSYLKLDELRSCTIADSSLGNVSLQSGRTNVTDKQ